MGDISIKAEDIGKEYVIGGAEQQHDSFRDMLGDLLRSPFQKFKTLSGNVAADKRFWALQHIDFEINAGDVVGVIGHNGAGKSTLLKVLSRITAPTTGRVAINGRVASLLEVGTGFHPELTGRENIYLNGSILGMRRTQIDQKFEEIVEFADVTQFLDTPVKRYSSGMGVRLAFSVAAHLDADVLLVDEVLAVGDQKFQEKCLGKLENVSSQGRTVLFVSHNLSSVSKLCSRSLVLDRGTLTFDGDVHEGISQYNHQMHEAEILTSEDYIGALFPKVSFSKIIINKQELQEGMEIDPFQQFEVSLEGVSESDIDNYKNVFSVRKDGQLIFSLYDCQGFSKLEKGQFRSTFKLPGKFLIPGEYTCSFGGVTDQIGDWLWTRDYRFNVLARWDDDYDSASSVLGIVNISSTGYRESGGG